MVMRCLGCLTRGAALLASAVFAAGCDSGEPVASGPSDKAKDPGGLGCGVTPEQKRADVPARPAVLVGCSRKSGGRDVRLYSLRDAGGPCIYIAGLPGGTRGCGRAPSERVPPIRAAMGGAVALRRSPDAPLEVYGETAPEVRRVVVRYRLPQAGLEQRRATLVRVSDRTALRAAGISQPFGYFVGAVPARAKQVLAEARGRSGAVLGRLAFDRLAGPTNPNVFIAIRPPTAGAAEGRATAAAVASCEDGGPSPAPVRGRDVTIGPLSVLFARRTQRDPRDAFKGLGWKLPVNLPAEAKATLSVPRRLRGRVGLVFTQDTQSSVLRRGLAAADPRVSFEACAGEGAPRRTGWPGGIVVDRKRCAALRVRVAGSATPIEQRVPLGRRCR